MHLNSSIEPTVASSGFRALAAPCKLLLFALAMLICGCGGNAVQTVNHEPVRVDNGPYQIGRDDLLDVMVWKQPQLSGQVRVSADGTITVPLVGQVPAVGLTTAQLDDDLSKRLEHFVHEPNVTVRVLDPTSEVFYVLGEVQKPGMYRLMSGEVLSQGLAESGGTTEFANLRKIKIIHRNRGQQVEMTVNYTLVQNGQDLSADVPLQRGDTIMVP